MTTSYRLLINVAVPQTLAERVRLALRLSGKTVQDVTINQDVHCRSIYKVLSGETKNPRILTIEAIAVECGVTTDFLINGGDSCST